MNLLIKASKIETPSTSDYHCEVPGCGKTMFFHKPFEREAIDEHGKPFTQYFGYGFVCPNVQHYPLRKPWGY